MSGVSGTFRGPGAPPATLAYIISAYKLPDQLIRLVRRLDTETSSFFVHVDRKTDDDTYRRMTEPLSGLDNVHFLERHRCHYGGFGHVEATIKGIRELFRRGIPFDHVLLLTGQDYPIASNRRIGAFFREHEGLSFMTHFPLPSDEWQEGGMDRIESWHVRLGSHYVRIPGIRARFGRGYPAGLRPFGGSAYWCLSRECTEFVHRFLGDARSYVRFFRFVDVPDEIFFQTILLNSPLRDAIVNDDLRYLEWRHPEVAGGPAVLRRADFENIMSSGKLFARKFDATEDAEILDLIDVAIRDE
ncbi:MAG TPA: beta-1,6-N-acetylglucosaminyltransferase [Gaiellaceae bacterium]|nr:beta-1,6-N-acetylglucosaminyltransferase [Gaiellaceae bacterium]